MLTKHWPAVLDIPRRLCRKLYRLTGQQRERIVAAARWHPAALEL